MKRTVHNHISSNSSYGICVENNIYGYNYDAVMKTKALVSQLCRNFYNLGWVSGTGGSVCIKHDDPFINQSSNHQLFVMSPSGVQKERMVAEDMFVVCSYGSLLFTPLTNTNPPKCTDSAVLFLKIHELRNAGAVIHSHAMESCIVTMINPFSKEFHMTNMEMIKGIEGHSYSDKLVVPIIENASHEADLLISLTEAVIAYPKSNAILVRNHGVYIWGETWISAKTQAECYHYLFGASLKLHQLGFDHFYCHNPSVNLPLQRYIILDIMTTAICSSSYSNNVTLYKDVQNLDMAGYVLSDDVPQIIKTWHSSGIKVYIYSSIHKRIIQSQFFRKSRYGALTKFLSGYFHTTTTIGGRYKAEIVETVGVEKPSDIMFVTESLNEALSAKTIGVEVAILCRPGTDPLVYGCSGIRTIKYLSEM